MGVRGCGWGSVCGVCKTGFVVRYTSEVEGHNELGDDDVEGGEWPDASEAAKGGGGEVGAVCKIEVCLIFLGDIVESLGIRYVALKCFLVEGAS